jgi:hypothetical protein
MIIGRQLDGAAFADMIIDQFDEMLRRPTIRSIRSRW